METRYFYLLRFILAWTDLLLINFCFFLGFYFSSKYYGNIDTDFFRENVFTCNLLWLVCTGVFGLYSECTIHKLELVYKATWRSVVLHTFVFLTYLFFTSGTSFPKSFFTIFYSLTAFSFIVSRFTGTALQSMLNKNFDIRKVVAVLGMNNGGLKLASYLQKQSSLNFVGFLGEHPIKDNEDIQVPSAIEQLRIASDSGVDEVFISVDPDKINDLTDLIKEGEKQCVRLKFVPDLSALETNFRFDKMGNFTVLCARTEPLENLENRFKKRLFDIIVSSFAIVFVLSWLYPILAILIKIQNPGPVLFKQLRSGRDNKPFWCFKFRSMKMNDASNHLQASLNDDRITSIGKFMRRTSLDEFPQFFNVLFGHMSVIGPRPHMLSHTEQYRKIIDKYMIRQFLKPGISGWAQINGFRGETKELSKMEERVEHDIWYMENWSVMLDVKVIFFTIINVFKGEENAY